MSDRKIIFSAVVSVVILLLFYFASFWDAKFSKESADWGAFGNYATICVSILSIALIYVTYREQRNTNEIVRTEQHISTMVNTILLLSKNKHSQIESVYKRIYLHFEESYYRISDYHCEGIRKVCNFYYNIDSENINDLTYLIQYVHLSINFIVHDNSLSNDTKFLRLTELTCIIPESIRIILFMWLVKNNNKELNNYYSYGIFSLNEKGCCLLKDIITYVCTTQCPPNKPEQKIDLDEILLEDYSGELFSKTYASLNLKTKNNENNDSY